MEFVLLYWKQLQGKVPNCSNTARNKHQMFLSKGLEHWIAIVAVGKQ